MGEIIAFRPSAAQARELDGAWDMRSAFADRFPDLAQKVDDALDRLADLPEKERSLLMGNMARHFKAMENVLDLLYEQNSILYPALMESYLTMKLKALTGMMARSNILHTYCTM